MVFIESGSTSLHRRTTYKMAMHVIIVVILAPIIALHTPNFSVRYEKT